MKFETSRPWLVDEPKRRDRGETFEAFLAANSPPLPDERRSTQGGSPAEQSFQLPRELARQRVKRLLVQFRRGLALEGHYPTNPARPLTATVRADPDPFHLPLAKGACCGPRSRTALRLKSAAPMFGLVHARATNGGGA